MHTRQHTGERPYSCLDCDHHFTDSSNYIKHMKGKHGVVSTRRNATYKVEQNTELQPAIIHSPTEEEMLVAEQLQSSQPTQMAQILQSPPQQALELTTDHLLHQQLRPLVSIPQ